MKNNAEDILDETTVESFRNGLRRKDLREPLGRERVRMVSHLMEIANTWADGEESVHDDHPQSLKDDDVDALYANEGGRRYTRDAGQRRKRKNRGYDEMEPEMVAAEFPGSHSNNYRRQAREPARESVR